MGEMNNRSVLQIRGPFEHSSGFPCDSMSAESTDEILSEFSGQFVMLYVYEDRRQPLISATRYESGSAIYSSLMFLQRIVRVVDMIVSQ